MSDFISKLRSALDQVKIGGSSIVAAVSGGPDSVALLRGLQAIQPQAAFELRVAHLDHGLRGAEGQGDADWVAALSERLHVSCIVESINVQEIADAEGHTIEEAARNARYDFLAKAARTHGCRFVAVGHTSDDQAETVLHNLLRGTGLAGLRGMPASRALDERTMLIRPLLAVTRDEVEAFLAEIGQDFRVDHTNADLSLTRNRLRRVVLPVLEREFGPSVRDALVRASRQAAEAQEFLESTALRLLERTLIDHSETARLDCTVLAGEPPHLVREVFVQLWKRKEWPRQAMGFREWDRLDRLTKEGGCANLPGNIEAARRGNLLAIRRR